MAKNKSVVTINGKEYTFVGEETQEYMSKIAAYIDAKITKIALACPNLNMQMVSTLATVNITDDYFKSLETADNLRLQVAQYIEDVSKDKGQQNIYRLENERLKDRIKELEAALSQQEYTVQKLTHNDGLDQTTL